MEDKNKATVATEVKEAQKELTPQQIDQVVKLVESKQVTKSQAFLKLYELGMTVGQISKVFNAHYSFVYGVISNKHGEVRKSSTNGKSKSDEIRELADEGKTPGEIAKALNSNYSYVHSVVKKHKMKQEAKIEG